MRTRAVVFDLDGTLVDSEPVHFAASEALLAEYGHTYTREIHDAHLGWTHLAHWQDLVPRFGLPLTPEECIARDDVEVIRAIRGGAACTMPGADHLVRELHAQGIPLAIASSSTHHLILETLDACGLTGCFEAIAGGDEVPRGKPAPDIYLLAAQRLGVAPKKCVAVEDAPAGIASARTAGMRVVAVCTAHNLSAHLAHADVVLPSLAGVTFADLGLVSR